MATQKLLLLLHAGFIVASTTAAAAACNYTAQKCGGIPIPYPFGMHPDCGLPNYRINCTPNSSLGSGPLPFLQLNDTIRFQVLNFSPAGFLIINATDFKAASCHVDHPASSALALPDPMPFRFSSDNIFATIGCNSAGNFTTFADDAGIKTTGSGSCTNPCYNTHAYDFCNSYACCTLGLPQTGATNIQITGAGIAYAGSPGLCGFSMVLFPGTYDYTASGVITTGHYGIKLSWGIPFPNNAPNCSTVNTTTGYACKENSECVPANDSMGYACNCSLTGYRGDGYKNGTGCEGTDVIAHRSVSTTKATAERDLHVDIDECKEGTSNCVGSPYGACHNLPGSFTCSCIDGAQGNGIVLWSNGTGCTVPLKPFQTSTVIIASTLSTAAALLFTGLLASWIYNWRASRAKKAMYFEKNGGTRLREYISVRRGRDTPRLFSEAELQKATQNFAGHLELGRGSYGTVYKGVLTDATLVAIKKSHHTEEQEVDQFINEVIILSQINHRNIVQLLGCCLETPVPILVYEYVPNGTLSEHLHGKDGRSALSWENRLVIALESAEAIAYLHSSISTPIYHRDIKSSNILLDKVLTPKVSDFGISRLLRLDETHVSTVVKGTMGYLDPEYFQSFQLTDKSDVYSFGVVLLELITSLKPVNLERGETESNLAMLCISRWKTGTRGYLDPEYLKSSLLTDKSDVYSFGVVLLELITSLKPFNLERGETESDLATAIDPALGASEDSGVMGSVNQVAKLAIACLRIDALKRPCMKQVLQEPKEKENVVGMYSLICFVRFEFIKFSKQRDVIA